MTTITIDIPSILWLSSNDRLHHMEKARRTRDIRALAAHRARASKPVPTPCRITAIIAYPTARKADAPNAWPTVKAAIDGCVDAGIIPDDDTSHVPVHAFERADGKSPRGRYLVTLRFEQVTA